MKLRLIDFGGQAPKRAHYNDAGLDVYLKKDIVIKPGDSVAIPLGFGVEIPDGFTGFICPRSSIALEGLSFQLSPIDSGYRGEVHALVQNISKKTLIFRENTRIGQLVIVPIILAELKDNLGEERNAGRFGSTGR